MKDSPKITKVDVVNFEHIIPEVGKDYNTFNMVYEPGGSVTRWSISHWASSTSQPMFRSIALHRTLEHPVNRWNHNKGQQRAGD